MGKREITMNKPVYHEQAILDLSKMLMQEFHYDYMRSKYGSKVKLCYMDRDWNFYRDIANDVEKRFDRSGYSKDDKKPLPIGKSKKEIGLMNDELSGKIMAEFVASRAKMYAYRKIDKEVEEKCCTGTKNACFLKALCVILIRPACLMVKRYIESNCCLRMRSMRCTRLISIRKPSIDTMIRGSCRPME